MTRRLLLLALAAAGASCGGPPPSPAPPAPPPAAAATSTVAESSLPQQPSLYELKAAMVNQRGEEIPFDVDRGHPTLLAMFYATCPSACPLLIEEIKKLEARLPDQTRARTRVLLVSLDPGKDTPEVMKKAAERHGVDETRWTLARAPEETVRDLAAILGVRYRAQPGGEIDHSSALFLLDAHGVIVEKVEGLGQPTDAIESRLLAM